MDIFAEIADERRVLADLLSGLTPQQRAAQSLCNEWTVQDVAGHLIVSLEVGLPKFALTMLACGGSFDRANDRLARKHAQRPFEEIVEVLRNKADNRFTPPGAGPEAPLTDVLVHGLDICWPLDIDRKTPVPAQRWSKALTFLTTRAANGLVVKGAMDGRAETRGPGHRMGSWRRTRSTWKRRGPPDGSYRPDDCFRAPPRRRRHNLATPSVVAPSIWTGLVDFSHGWTSRTVATDGFHHTPILTSQTSQDAVGSLSSALGPIARPSESRLPGKR